VKNDKITISSIVRKEVIFTEDILILSVRVFEVEGREEGEGGMRSFHLRTSIIFPSRLVRETSIRFLTGLSSAG
jgi:hypothetical protein